MMLVLVLIISSVLFFLRVFFEHWWIRITPYDGRVNIANGLRWLPEGMEKGTIRKHTIFTAFCLSANAICI